MGHEMTSSSQRPLPPFAERRRQMDKSEMNIFRRVAEQTPVPGTELEHFTVDGFDNLQDWLRALDTMFSVSERCVTVEEQAALQKPNRRSYSCLSTSRCGVASPKPTPPAR